LISNNIKLQLIQPFVRRKTKNHQHWE